ncbi:hypothetical protein CcaCcLH18_03541 [Colletotrichum camelliae]|nr:hypothetical protein CcaCcLH18_03541 [Colletotrichum camelliae]
MGEPSVPTTPAYEARGSHARNNHPQSDLPVGIEWPLRAESGSEGIPLTLLRDPDTGGNVGNAAERDYRANAEGLSSTQPLLDQYCRSSVDYDGPEPSDVSQKQHKVTGGDVRPPTHHARSWRPTWLQPTILLSFMISFLLLAVGLPVLFWYSHRHEGVREARPKFVHLWRFGPTAILTVVSILWSRVELQALRYEPWTVFLQEQPSAKRAAAYTLDYTSLLPPTVLVHSFRRGHYCVFFASIVSLILKIQIALAPGLFSSASIEVSQPVDFRVLDLFNTSVIFPNKETTAYYARQVFQNFEMRYPFGLTESAAYQTFGIGQQSSRGTVDAPLEVVVDGFLSDTQCLKLENYSLKKTVVEKYYFSFTMELRFENCEVLAQKYMYSLGSENELTGGVRSLWVIDHLLHTEHACQNLAQDASPELHSGLRFEIPPGNNSQPIVLDFAATLCSSTSWVSKVKVLDDGISPIVTTIPNGIKTPIKAELWTLISKILPPEASDWVLEGGPVQTEYAMRENRNYSTLDDNPSFYTSDVLYGALMNISRVLGPWAGHYLLREQHGDNYLQTKGIRRTRMSKLLVNKWVCFSMMVLFTILTFSVFLVLLRCRKRALIHWYRDPATILGSMLFLRDNTSLTSQVSIPASRLPPNELDTTWDDCRYTPFVLQIWVRITFLVFVISTFAALCYTTAISKTSDGLATIVHMDESYWNLLWTSLPATVMLSIALYISSSDSAHRNLAALSTLAQKPRNSVDLDMSLIDMLGLLSLYHSIKARLLAVTLAQILVMTCGFLSTLVSVVFTVEITPYSKAVEMKQTSWFASCAMKYTDDARTRRRLIGSLVLRQGDAALTWPRNTVFPYVSLIYYDTFGGMPEEFTAITRPHGRIPLEAFGDPSREAEIVGELNHNYAAFAAQLANLENRLDVDDSSRTGLLPPNLQSLTGTFTDGGRRRLVQNATVTYFILGILGLVILIHLTALLLNMFRRVDGETWIFDMEVKGLAPDGLHSIAAAIALLKDSNALAHLPEGAHLLSLDELHGRLANLRFRMGWFQSADEDRKFTVGVGGDDDFKFLGTKKKLEHITS